MPKGSPKKPARRRRRRRGELTSKQREKVKQGLLAAGYNSSANEKASERRRDPSRRTLSADNALVTSSSSSSSSQSHSINLEASSPPAEDDSSGSSSSSSRGELQCADAKKVDMGESLRIAASRGQREQWEAAMISCPAEDFLVRDFGYSESKLKVSSCEALFTSVGADCVSSAGPLHHFNRRIRFPPAGDDEYVSAVVPHYLSINMQIPKKSKALMGSGKRGGAPPTPTINGESIR